MGKCLNVEIGVAGDAVALEVDIDREMQVFRLDLRDTRGGGQGKESNPGRADGEWQSMRGRVFTW